MVLRVGEARANGRGNEVAAVDDKCLGRAKLPLSLWGLSASGSSVQVWQRIG